MHSSDFINEPIEPIGLTIPKAGLVQAPQGFRWRDQVFVIIKATSVKAYGRDRSHGSSERYLDKEWFDCMLSNGATAKIYFERRSRGGSSRWFIYSYKSSR